MPTEKELKERLAAMIAVLPNCRDGTLFFVNPDCGLKTRAWKETEGTPSYSCSPNHHHIDTCIYLVTYILLCVVK